MVESWTKKRPRKKLPGNQLSRIQLRGITICRDIEFSRYYDEDK